MPHYLNAVELAEHRILTVLFLDFIKQPEQWIDRERMAAEYHVNVEERLFVSVLADLESRGWVDTWMEVDGGQEVTAAMLRESKYSKALSRILDTLEAKTFDVDWQTKRITTDAPDHITSDLVPSPNGWMLLRFEKEETVAPRPRSEPVARASSPGRTSHTAGRDINIFNGAASQNNSAPTGDSWWTKSGVILTAIGIIIAALALYFTDSFPWKWSAKPSAVQQGALQKQGRIGGLAPVDGKPAQ